MRQRRVFRALMAAGAALVVAGGVTAGFTVSAVVVGALPACTSNATKGPPGATLTVSPCTGLNLGQMVTVTGAGLAGFNGTAAVAVVECGNADSSGKALPLSQAGMASNCYGAESLATHQTQLLTVASDTATTKYSVQSQNIGASKIQCIKQPPANFPCVIAMADVGTQGKELQLAQAITFATGAPPPTTTTTSHPTTTTTSSKSLGQTVGVVVSSSSTTTTTTTAPTTTTSSPSSTAATSSATTTTAPTSPSAAKGALASTGVSTGLLVAAVVGFLLLDLGYLALSVRRQPRWARQLLAAKASGVTADRETRQ